MAVSPETLELIDRLAGGEAGPDLRSSPHAQRFEAIKEARRDAREEERLEGQEARGSQEAETHRAAAMRNWQAIENEADGLLMIARDLTVACWRAEAAVRLGGLPALRDAVAVIDALVRTWWDQGLHPQQGGAPERLLPLAGLLGGEHEGTLIRPIRSTPLATDADGLPVALWQYETPALRPAFTAALSGGQHDYLRDSYIAAGDIVGILQDLGSYISMKAGAEALSIRQVREACEQLRAALQSYAPPAQVDDPVAEDLPADAEITPDSGGNAPVAQGGIRDREDALRRLLAIAEHFERTEPNGIVALALRELIRRARLPLAELLMELLPNEDARQEFLNRAGIGVSK